MCVCVSHLDSVDKLVNEGVENCNTSLVVLHGEGLVCGARWAMVVAIEWKGRMFADIS